uniref:Uncharacterized protein n=1 Tax=Panagrolaimus davidi TaxID=227884 RepID=A0A914QL84_9BILA
MPPMMGNPYLDEDRVPIHALFWNRVTNGLGVRMLQGIGKETGCFILSPGQSESIFEMFNAVLPRYKSAIFKVFDSQIADFPTNAKLCEKLHAKFDELNIPHCFITEEQANVTRMLGKAKADLNVSETFLSLRLDGETFMVTEYEYTETGSKKIGYKSVSLKSSGEVSALLEELLSKNVRYNFLSTLTRTNPWLKKIRKMFPESKLWILDLDLSEDGRDVVLEEMSQWMGDKSYTKYYVLPTTVRNLKIMNTAGESLIDVEVGEALPLTKSIVVPKSVDMVMIYQTDSKAPSVLIEKIEHKCHQTEIIVMIDTDNFATIEYIPVMVPKIGSLRKWLNDETTESKEPFIGFCDNFSVIAVHQNDEDGFKFVNEWNDIDGHTVVYLIKILSMPPDNITIDDRWGFNVTADDEHPVLLEFKAHDGKLTVAEPDFLMALLLKEHIKVIRNVMGEKPDKLGFCILDEKHKDEEKERIKNGLESARKKLKIQCHFADV